MGRSELFKCRCRKCQEYFEPEEDRYIIVLEERNNDVRQVCHKHKVLYHYHIRCFR